MVYQDPTIDMEQMWNTMRHLYFNYLSRNDGHIREIAGRGSP